ncbi:hypothetical protein [Gordonia sp. 852002-51296_SCH5728562-b]|uniref:hypothetical protein n=1 Tax=Gordonia sp. 852002-51296_SCH5728562-b TaxID=1834101 RepID=UPI000B02ADCC|nr:hypothetical protein [Gordonia sp. 852002-51296_SCH5728562-b]
MRPHRAVPGRGPHPRRAEPAAHRAGDGRARVLRTPARRRRNPRRRNGIVEAVAELEAALGRTNTIGVIHASPRWAAHAADHNLLQFVGGGAPRTPLGHLWVFGGGYEDSPMSDTLVATSPLYGWRDAVAVRDTIEARYNQYVAIAERSVVIGYERAIGAATITTTP